MNIKGKVCDLNPCGSLQELLKGCQLVQVAGAFSRLTKLAKLVNHSANCSLTFDKSAW